MSKEIFINIIPNSSTDHLFHIFMECLMKQNYPKDKLTLYFDVAMGDRSYEYLKMWIPVHEKKYKQIALVRNSTSSIPSIRNANIDDFCASKCEYYLSINPDCFLLDTNLILKLLYHNKDFIAPMCDSTPDNTQSNFICAVSTNGYFVANNDFSMVKRREITGIIEVPLAHVVYLASGKLFENTKIRYDESDEYDFITLPRNIRSNGKKMYLMNEEVYCLTISRMGDALSKIQERNLIISEIVKYHGQILTATKQEQSILSDVIKHLEDEESSNGNYSVIDLGANVGLYTISFSKSVGDKGWVYSYEENKERREKLKRHVDCYMVENVKVLDEMPKLRSMEKIRMIRIPDSYISILDDSEFIERNKPYIIYYGTNIPDLQPFIRSHGYFPPVTLYNDVKFLIPM